MARASTSGSCATRCSRSDPRNEYVAFYSDAAQAGRYRDRPNVREVVVPGPDKLLWDQVLVPLGARRDGISTSSSTTSSASRWSPPCPTVVQQRGTEYWSHPEFYAGGRDAWTGSTTG